jgi:hypothetical protein
MTDLTKTTNTTPAISSRLAAAIEEIDPTKARLAFIIDATASREHCRDVAAGLMADMFRAATAVGTVEIQITYFRGESECQSSKWISSASALATILSALDCRAGYTQIARALRHVVKEHAKQTIHAVILVGDSAEEHGEIVLSAARELSSVPVFSFHEGHDKKAAEIFKAIAHTTKGAFAAFDSGSADRLRELLKAVVLFAQGGRKALAAHGGEAPASCSRN